ncbi:MAG TPA: winged helix-turn-helix domain-containing protein [Blastocatellia bacterium]|nr:winged helix-turn-helix domain-containing protein [Blastocatellia bacterium]
MSQPAKYHYEFGPFRLHPVEHLLLCHREVVPLPPKVFDILLLLVQNHGHLLGKEEIIRAIWPDTCVEEGNLTRYISTLRQALGEQRRKMPFILTVPKLGYRFVARVREVWNETVAQRTATPSNPAAHSIVVLPFKPYFLAERNEALEWGMTDAIITRLSHSGQVAVIPTCAVRQYTDFDRDALSIGRELMVKAVLDGSIQQSGELLRMTAQLVRVEDGMMLWADQFDKQFTNIFMVQDSISAAVLKALTICPAKTKT